MDPDHDPFGRPLERRALQLGLRGSALRRYACEALLAVEDVTAFVIEPRAMRDRDVDNLRTPEERVYLPADIAA